MGHERPRPSFEMPRKSAAPLDDDVNVAFRTNKVAPAPHNHFFHLKNTYGSTAAISIMTSAIG
jgi:hypothetical protein